MTILQMLDQADEVKFGFDLSGNELFVTAAFSGTERSQPLVDWLNQVGKLYNSGTYRGYTRVSFYAGAGLYLKEKSNG